MGIYARHNDEWYRVDECDADANGGGAPGAAVIDSVVADDPLYPVKTSSFEEDGQAYDVYEFLGSGELVVSEPGVVDMLLVGGGGAGANNAYARRGSGGGGAVKEVTVFATEDGHPVVVGAGGTATTNRPGGAGESSSLINVLAIGGGGGWGATPGPSVAARGASSGGLPFSETNYEHLYSPLDGYVGGKAAADNAGGGGAGGPGGNPNHTYGGPGLGSSITGADILYAAGGSGSTDALQGDANTGNGGNKGGNLGHGGSGIVIVRVKVATKSFGDRTRSATPKTAHAARIEDGVVRQVITIPHLNDDDNKITEYCNKIGLPGTWVDTSYTGARRGKYAGVGDLFDPRLRNAEFVSPEVEVEE